MDFCGNISDVAKMCDLIHEEISILSHSAASLMQIDHDHVQKILLLKNAAPITKVLLAKKKCA